jgi:hypothetical protein
MSYEITYKSKYTGKTEVHKCDLSEGHARGWAEYLSKNHETQATAEHVADGPYDCSGKRTHIVTEGHDR